MCLDMCRSTFMTGLSDGPQTLQAQTVELGCKTMEVLWGGWDITSTSIQFLQYHYNPMYILKWPTQFNFNHMQSNIYPFSPTQRPKKETKVDTSFTSPVGFSPRDARAQGALRSHRRQLVPSAVGRHAAVDRGGLGCQRVHRWQRGSPKPWREVFFVILGVANPKKAKEVECTS